MHPDPSDPAAGPRPHVPGPLLVRRDLRVRAGRPPRDASGARRWRASPTTSTGSIRPPARRPGSCSGSGDAASAPSPRESSSRALLARDRVVARLGNGSPRWPSRSAWQPTALPRRAPRPPSRSSATRSPTSSWPASTRASGTGSARARSATSTSASLDELVPMIRAQGPDARAFRVPPGELDDFVTALAGRGIDRIVPFGRR